MKGIMMAVANCLFMMGVIITMTWYVNYEYTRNHLQSALKQSLRTTMMQCEFRVCNQTTTVALFATAFSSHLHSFENVSWSLMGFSQDPLLLRVRVQYSYSQNWINSTIVIDEAIMKETIKIEE